MKNQNYTIWAKIKDWHSLTEIRTPQSQDSTDEENKPHESDATNSSVQPSVVDLIPALMKLLYDIITYPYSNISKRIKRLSMSARMFEQAKREGLEKGLIIESSAGQTIFLIPTKKAYAALNIDCPYKRAPDEHSFYVGAVVYVLKKHPHYRSVTPEAKIGSSNASADCITIAHDGTRKSWEITLSTTNVLANAAKYTVTDFATITFVCRDYKLKEAVKACCREGSLDPNLLSRLDYTHISALIQRQRKMYAY